MDIIKTIHSKVIASSVQQDTSATAQQQQVQLHPQFVQRAASALKAQKTTVVSNAQLVTGSLKKEERRALHAPLVHIVEHQDLAIQQGYVLKVITV